MLDNVTGNCCGCGGCYAVCPVSAISMSPDSEGFLKPSIDENRCIDCGRCESVCHKGLRRDCLTSYNECAEYYGYSKDIGSVRMSSSGAIGYELGKSAISDGYKVFGVRYDKYMHEAVADIAAFMPELEAFRGSKYVQADFSDAFRRVLVDDSKYLVIATPCLIFEMLKAVELLNRRDDFIFVDFVCHGIPPKKLWHRYLEKYGELSDISNMSFRGGDLDWHKIAIRCDVPGGTVISPRESDEYYRFFDDGVYMNRSCYNCTINNGFGVSDIRIGDAWGKEFSQNHDGVSRIIIGSERGDQFFHRHKENIIYGIPEERIIMPKSNRLMIHETARSKISADLNLEIPIKKMIFRYRRRLSVKHRIISVMPKKLIKLILTIRDYLKQGLARL